MGSDAGPRGPYRAGVRRRQEIVDAAVGVFGSRGYVGATIKQVADAVGVTSAAVLRYFSKEELLMAVLAHWEQHQYRPPEPASGLAYFRAFDALMAYHAEHRRLLELFLVFATEAADPAHPAHDFMARRYRLAIAEMRAQIAAGIAAGDFRPMREQEQWAEARLFCAALDGLEIQFLLLPDVDLRGLVQLSVDRMLARWRPEDAAAADRRDQRRRPPGP